MANIFRRKKTLERNFYQQKYNISRANLLAVVAFTLINIVLLVLNANVYFLFSAAIPYLIADVGMLLCGRYPEEFYADLGDVTFYDNSVFAILLVVAIAITLIYLLAWALSNKNRGGWLVFALMFFAIDTLVMLFVGGFSIMSVVDLLFHAWVIYDLIVGIKASDKLKELNTKKKFGFFGRK